MKYILSFISMVGIVLTSTANAGLTVLDETCVVNLAPGLSEQYESKIISIVERKKYTVSLEDSVGEHLSLNVEIDYHASQHSRIYNENATATLKYQTGNPVITRDSNGREERHRKITRTGYAAMTHSIVEPTSRIIRRRASRRNYRAVKRAVRALPPCERNDSASN